MIAEIILTAILYIIVVAAVYAVTSGKRYKNDSND